MTMTNHREESQAAEAPAAASPSVTVNGQIVHEIREDRVQRAQMFIELGKMDTPIRVERALDRILEDFEARLLEGLDD